MHTQRIGIYTGAFDPIHSGHLSFALQAISKGVVSEVYFMPERKPHGTTSVEHYGHRVAMLRQAIKPHGQLALLEVADRQFNAQKTITQLRRMFPDIQLVFLMGAEVFVRIPEWQHAQRFVQNNVFLLAVSSREELTAVNATIALLGIPAASVAVLDSVRPEVSGAQQRYAIRRNKRAKGLLLSVEKYAKREWLYASVRQNV